MQELLHRLSDLADEGGQLVMRASDLMGADAVADEELVTLLRVAGSLARQADALVTAAVERVQARSTGGRDEKLTTRLGCASIAELLRRTTRCDSAQAAVFVRAARALPLEFSITAGEALPGRFPALREALREGAIGAAGLAHATRPLIVAHSRIAPADLELADRILAAAARGISADDLDQDGRSLVAEGSLHPPANSQELKTIADVLVARLDQDGTEPLDERAMRGRALVLGAPDDTGLVPVRGALVADVAAQLMTLVDAVDNPHGAERRRAGVQFTPDDPGLDAATANDGRTRAQRMHDALAVVLGIAARAVDAPTIGGAAPTLVVTMSAEGYKTGRWAHLDGLGPVPGAVGRQVGCSGSIQRVLHDAGGRIVSITTSDRVFNAAQRKAIIARDGTCVLPGCAVPARWCEIHHVKSHARGGPTSTDNGVALCWLHHRTIERVGWELTMRDGIPYVRGPSWWDADRQWRRASKPPGFATSPPPGLPTSPRGPAATRAGLPRRGSGTSRTMPSRT